MSENRFQSVLDYYQHSSLHKFPAATITLLFENTHCMDVLTHVMMTCSRLIVTFTAK